MNPIYKKIARRLVPYLVLLYMVAFLDRVNISFAALTMNRDLGITETLYGFAAGVFFLSYCLFEVPANLMLSRIGARRWIAILLVVWGVVSVSTAFVGTRSDYIAARCVLGVAESGFFPGVIFYLTLWLPRTMRTRIMALFLLSLPLCNSLGSPLSAHILLLDHVGGLRGWQWLFVLEGAPAVILGAVTWFVLADNPATARWLSPAEKDDLAQEMRNDEAQSDATSQRPRRAKVLARILWDSAAYFALNSGLYGLNFFLPKILVASGVTPEASGWWAVLPYGAGAVGMVLMSRKGGRWWLAGLYLCSGAGFGLTGLARNLPEALVGFALASVGMYAAVPMFWSASTGRMSSRAAGTAIATVNSIGVIGGFAGPYAMGWLHDATHSYSAGLWAIGGTMAAGALAVACASAQREPAPSHAGQAG
jgi:ACS family tartrate transporter-like MFS transporter